jgi:hypothetical protein
MRFTYKTKNQNYLIPDRGWARFININGNHLRWVDAQEFISKFNANKGK